MTFDLSHIPSDVLAHELRVRRGETLPADYTTDDGYGGGCRFRLLPDGRWDVTPVRWVDDAPQHSQWPEWLTPEFCASYRGGPHPGCPSLPAKG